MIAAAVLLTAGAAFCAAGVVAPARRLVALAPRGVRRPGVRITARSEGRPASLASLCDRLLLVLVLVIASQAPTSAILLAPLAVAARAVLARSRATALLRAAAAAAPDACRVLAAALSAGSLPSDALTAAARGQPSPLAETLRAAAGSEALGTPASTVLASPPPGCEAMRAVAVCWEVSLGSGGALARSLESLAVALDAELEAVAVIDTELAGVRLSAVVMACLPALGLALGAALGSAPLHFLLGTPLGQLALAGALLLDGAGLLWVSWLAARAAR